ncbi:hypothetical protein Tco_0445413 [Tanacetum coccineum]
MSSVGKIVHDSNKAPDSPPHPHTISSNQRHCFHCKDVLGDGEFCQRCTCMRCGSGLSKGLCLICASRYGNNPNPNSLNDSPNISENVSQSPPLIDHHCCYECGDSLDDIFCQRCTCKSCGNGAHYGYNCPPKVPIISNPEPCNNQTVDELPQTLPSFDPTCYSGDGNSFTYDSTPNFVNDSPNVFNPPPQPQYVPYSCELCGNDAHHGYDCPPQVPFLLNSQNDIMEQMTSMCDMIGQYMQKKEEEKRIAEEQAAKNRHWKIPICYDDDDDKESSIPLRYIIIFGLPSYVAITPVLSTEEPVDSLIMEDEHLDTILTTESDEVIKSSVEDLVPIPSKFEGIPDKMCDVPFRDNSLPLDISKDQFEGFSDSNDDSTSIDDDSFSIDDIDYVEASPLDSELVRLEEVKDFHTEDREIEDDILREKLSKINLLIAKIEAINSNPPPSSDFVTKSPSTFPNSFLEETNTFDNSIPESETFCFDLEENSSGSTTTRSDYSLPDYEAFYFDDDHIEEKSSGSTTTHSDISLSKYDSFIFDLSNDPFPPADRSDFYHEEFADELAHIISPPEYDCFYFKSEPDPGELTSIVDSGIRENVLSTPRVHVPNVLPTHPTLHLDSDFTLSSDSPGSDLVVSFPSKTRNKIFDLGIFIGVQSKIFLSPDEFSISFIRDPPFPVIDTLIPLSSENEAFNHGVLTSKEKSPPSSSHRGFKAFQLISESPMMIHGENTPNLEKQHQPEVIQELLNKLLNDVQIIIEEQADYINSPSWNRPAICYDDDDDEESSIPLKDIIIYGLPPCVEITPVLLTEEPIGSLIMEDEHLDTIPTTESDEVIKSSIEDLVLIPSKSEDIPDKMCDVPFHDNSPPLDISKDQFKAKSLEVVEIVIPKVGGIDTDILLTIKDDILREKLLNVNLLIAKIKALKDNPTPSFDFVTKSSFTSLNFFLEETNTFDNSLPESETFCFNMEEISSGSPTSYSDLSLPDYEAFFCNSEPDSGNFTIDVVDDIFDNPTREPRVHVPNVLPTHLTLHLDSDFTLSSDSLGSDLVVSFPSGTRNKIFDPGIFIGVQSMRFLSLDEFSISFIRDLPFPVIDTFLPFSPQNEDKVFNPGILASNEETSPHLLSYRGFNPSKIISDFSESPMMIYGGDIPILDVPFLHFYPP